MKISVVDDERDTQALFEQRFRKEIREKLIEFAFAFSGDDALTYLSQPGHQTVLILSDINMPGMSGLELLCHIKQKFVAPFPVVRMITVYGETKNYYKAQQLRDDDFLTKPVDFAYVRDKFKILVKVFQC